MTIAWIIAGHDSSGGAGISNDIKTFSHFNVHTCQIITAITAQNNQALTDLMPLTKEGIQSQLDAAKVNSLKPTAIKLGMVKGITSMLLLAQLFEELQVPVIADPILSTSSGYKLLTPEEVVFYKQHLLPKINVLTPNKEEAEILSGMSIDSLTDVERVANKLLALGIQQVIVKGGHLPSHIAEDYWSNKQEACWLSTPRDAKKKVRGTGCVFASAIAACLAKGDDIQEAFAKAKCYVTAGIKKAKRVEQKVWYFTHAANTLMLPTYRNSGMKPSQGPFSADKMGYYPIVDNLQDLQQLSTLGYETIQLRVKNLETARLSTLIQQCCSLAQREQIKLYINDYWELAIQHGAYGVHLGQEDLRSADMAAIKLAGLRVGLTAHNLFELIVAKSLQPSYIAIGPVFHSKTKPQLTPLSVAKIKSWRKRVLIPLVAIGGVTSSRVERLKKLGFDGFAAISAVKEELDAKGGR